jgi:hypothetical protein
MLNTPRTFNALLRSGAIVALVLLGVDGTTAGGHDAALGNTPGLYCQNGVLLKDGRPYRGVGANDFALFSRLLANPADATPLENLKALKRAGIPWVRFMACGFWPSNQRLYREDKAAYFQRLDQVVRAAEQCGMGLIPSLFWNLATVPDVAGEPMDQLGNPQSKTIAAIRRYTEEVVGRYRNSPAIWGWEFGNECNLAADLPNASSHRPPIVPALGTPRERSGRDELHFSQLHTAFEVFGHTVRQIDRRRILVTGNSIPRASAYHNVLDHSWTLDSEEQFGEMLLRDNPDPFDVICIHLYPEPKGIYPGGAHTIDEATALAVKYAARAGKPLLIGEFGAARELGPPSRQRAVFEEFLGAIVRQRVPLAAFWVFDYKPQDDCNVDFRNDRAYMIDLASQANRQP